MGVVTTRTRENSLSDVTYCTHVDLGVISKIPVNFTGVKTVIRDNCNKDFAKIRKAGGVVLSDVQLSRTERSFSSGDLWCDQGGQGGGYHYYGDVTGHIPSIIGLPYVETLSMATGDQLLIKAQAKMKSSGVMSGETLATLGQTISMMRHPLKGASELLDRMGRYRKLHLGKTAKSAAKATKDAWLEYRYGWAPLIMDTDKVFQESFRRLEKCERKRLVVRAGANASASGSLSWTANTGGPTANSKGTHTLTHSCRRHVGIVFDVKPQTSAEALSELFGTRLRDIPGVMWELVPYSFVVDWFVGVGDWIEAVMPVPGVVVRGTWVTNVDESTSVVNATSDYKASDPTPLNWRWLGSFGGYVYKNTVYERVCNPLPPTAPVALGNPLSRLHQIDAVALSLGPVLAKLKGFRH